MSLCVWTKFMKNCVSIVYFEQMHEENMNLQCIQTNVMFLILFLICDGSHEIDTIHCRRQPSPPHHEDLSHEREDVVQRHYRVTASARACCDDERRRQQPMTEAKRELRPTVIRSLDLHLEEVQLICHLLVIHGPLCWSCLDLSGASRAKACQP